jgi:hypothetical protein
MNINLNESAAGTAGTVTGRRDEISGKLFSSAIVIPPDEDNKVIRRGPEDMAAVLARCYRLVIQASEGQP